jgi:hypothetical protein
MCGLVFLSFVYLAYLIKGLAWVTKCLRLKWGEKGDAKTPYALVVKWFMRIHSVNNAIGVFCGY